MLPAPLDFQRWIEDNRHLLIANWWCWQRYRNLGS